MRFLVFFYVMKYWLKIILPLDALLYWLTTPLRAWRQKRVQHHWGDLERSIELTFAEFESTSGAIINEEYCWMHQPGGWTCEICREEQTAEGSQLQ